MSAALDVYLYGMTVLSTVHRVALDTPTLDGYGEILESHVCPGGEAMNGALVLSSLGLKTALGGPHWGTETARNLGQYAARAGIDVKKITVADDHPGVRDLVLVCGAQRCVLGWFGSYFSQNPRRWDEPDAQAIARARVVAIDPFFGDSSLGAADLCRDAGKPYVTIDCEAGSELQRHAAATVVSREYRKRQFPGAADEQLLGEYTALGAGLTIFTSGSDPLYYARAGNAPRSVLPPKVNVTSTLGAGDVFRAGIVYGLVREQSDSECVEFATALAALCCTRFPIADHAPSLAEVEAFRKR